MKYQETHLDGFPHPLEELYANKLGVRSQESLNLSPSGTITHEGSFCSCFHKIC